MAPIIPPSTLRTTGALLETHIAVSRLIERRAVSTTDTDPTTVDLLVRLDQAPEQRLRAVELSRQLQLSPSHVSRTIDRAAAADLVTRESDPDDRRAAQVVLTDPGRDLLRRFAPAIRDTVEAIVDDALSPEETDTLIGLLDRVRNAAQAEADGDHERDLGN
ncbi:MAG: MarR family transcriptional regulator [Actinomycetota bacterium]